MCICIVSGYRFVSVSASCLKILTRGKPRPDFFKKPGLFKSPNIFKGPDFQKSRLFQKPGLFQKVRTFQKSRLSKVQTFFQKPKLLTKTATFSKTRTFSKSSNFSKNPTFKSPDFFKNPNFFKKPRLFQILKSSNFSQKPRLFQKVRTIQILKGYKNPTIIQPFLPGIMATNTLAEFSDGEDDWVFEIDNDLWNNSEDGNVIRSINEDEVLNQTGPIEMDDLWNDSEDDDLIRSIDEDEVLNQTGRGEKRKSDDQDEEPQQDYYHIESVKKHHSKKFRMTATDYTVQFNNVLHDVDLLESQERTHTIFHHLLKDVTAGMNPNDQVRFILRSDQLQTPISIPFLPLEELTTERVFSQIEKVIQSNEDFRLNDTVTVDIIHVETPQGSGKREVKRTTVDVREYLKKKGSVVTINNKDDFCLGRALSVAIARIEKDPRYGQIKDSKKHIQLDRALDLHQAANVPLQPCGLNEVKLFQQYLTNYQIIVISGDHNNCIIYPPQPPVNPNPEKSIYLYFHANHFDVITSIPGFLNKNYFCHRCHKPYDHASDHLCPTMCRSCRGFGCVYEGDGIVCNECNRLFKNQACYDHHKEPMNGGGRSVCEVIRKCPICGKAMDVRKLNSKSHICGKKCPTCGVILDSKDTDHQCYIQQQEYEEGRSYNHLLFFDFEATQEHGIPERYHCHFLTRPST